jgi:hypothetical protein
MCSIRNFVVGLYFNLFFFRLFKDHRRALFNSTFLLLETFILIENLDQLLFLLNLKCIEIHILFLLHYVFNLYHLLGMLMRPFAVQLMNFVRDASFVDIGFLVRNYLFDCFNWVVVRVCHTV